MRIKRARATYVGGAVASWQNGERRARGGQPHLHSAPKPPARLRSPLDVKAEGRARSRPCSRGESTALSVPGPADQCPELLLVGRESESWGRVRGRGRGVRCWLRLTWGCACLVGSGRVGVGVRENGGWGFVGQLNRTGPLEPRSEDAVRLRPPLPPGPRGESPVPSRRGEKLDGNSPVEGRSPGTGLQRKPPLLTLPTLGRSS